MPEEIDEFSGKVHLYDMTLAEVGTQIPRAQNSEGTFRPCARIQPMPLLVRTVLLCP